MHLVYLTNEEKKKITDGITKAAEDISNLSNDINTKAGAIKEKASGEVIVVTDSDERKPLGLAIDGKSEQNQYSGNQLIDFGWRENSNANGLDYSVNDDGSVLANGTATTLAGFSLNITDKGYLAGTYFVKPTNITGVTARLVCASGDGSTTVINGGSYGELADFNSYTSVLFQILTEAGTTLSNKVIYPMLNRGTSELPWEPYCGGIPSPNPSYPQEIRNIGVYDEASGKYKVEVKCTGKNLLKNTATSKTFENLTITVNDDKSIRVKGELTTSTFFDVYIDGKWEGTDNILPISEGKILVSNCPSSETTNVKMVVLQNSTEVLISTSTYSSVLLDISNGLTGLLFRFELGNKYDMTIYPMIRECDENGNPIGDDTYEPYKETTTTVLLDEPLRKGDKAYWNGGSKLRIDRYRAVEVFDGSVDEGWEANGGNAIGIRYYIDLTPQAIASDKNKGASSLNTSLQIASTGGTSSIKNVYTITSDSKLYISLNGTESLEELKTYLSEKPMTVEYTLATPITEEIDLSLDGLSMFYPTTILSNDCNANMEVTYVVDTKTYIDKKFAELAATMS